MKRWVLFVLFSILLGCPTVSGAADDIFDSGKATLFNYPLMKIPLGANPDSKTLGEQKVEGDAKNDDNKDKQVRDNKVDDAIKRAWGEK